MEYHVCKTISNLLSILVIRYYLSVEQDTRATGSTLTKSNRRLNVMNPHMVKSYITSDIDIMEFFFFFFNLMRRNLGFPVRRVHPLRGLIVLV